MRSLADLFLKVQHSFRLLEESAKTAQSAGLTGIEDKLQARALEVLEKAKAAIEQALEPVPEPPI